MDIVDQLKLMEAGKVTVFPRDQTIREARETIEQLRGIVDELRSMETIERLETEADRLRTDYNAMRRLALDSDETNDRLRIALHRNACRYRPELTHDEIDAEIERIVRGDEQRETAPAATSKSGTCVDGEPNACTQPFNWDDGVPCSQEMMEKGVHVFLTHSISSNRIERWVKEVAHVSGQPVDWHFIGGRANVLTLGDVAAVKKAIEELMPLHDQLRQETIDAYKRSEDTQ